MNQIEFEYQDIPIGGKLITATLIVDGDDAMNLIDDIRRKEIIKEKLLIEMCDSILSNKLAEFTMHKNPMDDRVAYRVRCYLAKDSDVKILRLAKL